MTSLFVSAAAALLVMGSAYLWRLMAGPTAFDRILGLAGFTSNATVLLLLIGLVFGRLDMFVDIALGYALLGFVSVLAAARYFEETPRR